MWLEGQAYKQNQGLYKIEGVKLAAQHLKQPFFLCLYTKEIKVYWYHQIYCASGAGIATNNDK